MTVLAPPSLAPLDALLRGASLGLSWPVLTGSAPAAAWRSTGPWHCGQVVVPDAADAEAAALQAYRTLFARLAGLAPLRLWNVVPRIHDEDAGLERYRRFNAGRQQAFAEAGADGSGGAPAACALGSAGGPMVVRWLAAARPGRTVENPRQVPAYRYDERYGPVSPTFSRAVVAGDMLLVSGTASIVGQETLHAGDAEAQAAETLDNLQALLEAAGPFALADLRATVYLRDPAHRAVVAPLLAEAGLADPLYLRADVCRRDLLVEIDGHVPAR